MDVRNREQRENTYFSTRATRSMFFDALDAIEKCPGSSLKKFLLFEIDRFNLADNDNHLSGIDHGYVESIGDKIVFELKNHNSLTEILKAGIQLLISLLVHCDISTLIPVQTRLKTILYTLKEKQTEDFEWFYNTLLENLTQSQQDKLKRAHVPELSGLPKVVETSGDVSKKKIIITKLSKAFVPSKKPPNDSNRELQSTFAFRLIELYSSTPYLLVVSDSSAGFLGLDRAGKEAICWKQLEMSRSNNKDLARLAGAIAWKIWLLKKPLLKKYCLDNDTEFNDLTFSKRAELTRKAVETYTEEERARILDEAVEKELERRKKSFQPEKRPKFKGKRVSIGAELEITYPPFDLGVIYAWYENLERRSAGESRVFEEEVNETFATLAAARDLQELYDKVWKISQKADELAKKVIDANLGDIDKDVLKSRVQELVDAVPNREIKAKLISEIVHQESDIIDPNLVNDICNYWKKLLLIIDSKRSQAQERFESLSDAKPDEIAYKKKSFYPNKKISRDAKILLDFFLHQMGQAQALGHVFKYDSYGEHALAYISGDFRDPYSLFSREIWELAHSLFHDFESEERPMHITIGWNDYVKRGLHISETRLTAECSVLNFALTASGVGNRKSIQVFHEKDLKAKSEGREGSEFINYDDTGRSGKIIRNRHDFGTISSIEFRGFAPRKNEFPRLAKQIGNLGTAMIAWFAVDILDDPDQVDVKLAKIWTEFRQRIIKVHEQYKNFPDLFNANSWTWSTGLHKVTNFYREISNTLDDEDGLMKSVAKIVAHAERQVNAVFDDVPPPGIEPGVAA